MTLGDAKVHPLAKISRTATDGRVNGRRNATYCKYIGIPSSGQKIPKKRENYFSLNLNNSQNLTYHTE